MALWTYLQSEFAAGIWIGSGWSPVAAVWVCTAIGSIATFNWWLLIFLAPNRWLSKPWIAKKIGHAAWSGANRNNWQYRWGSYATPLLAAIPDGGVLVGLIIARLLGLNKWRTLALVFVGNAIKNLFLGGMLSTILVKNPILKKNIDHVSIGILLIAGLVTIAMATRTSSNGHALNCRM